MKKKCIQFLFSSYLYTFSEKQALESRKTRKWKIGGGATTRTHLQKHHRKWNVIRLRMCVSSGIGSALEIVLLTLIRIHSDWLEHE